MRLVIFNFDSHFRILHLRAIAHMSKETNLNPPCLARKKHVGRALNCKWSSAEMPRSKDSKKSQTTTTTVYDDSGWIDRSAKHPAGMNRNGKKKPIATSCHREDSNLLLPRYQFDPVCANSPRGPPWSPTACKPKSSLHIELVLRTPTFTQQELRRAGGQTKGKSERAPRKQGQRSRGSVRTGWEGGCECEWRSGEASFDEFEEVALQSEHQEQSERRELLSEGGRSGIRRGRIIRSPWRSKQRQNGRPGPPTGFPDTEGGLEGILDGETVLRELGKTLKVDGRGKLVIPRQEDVEATSSVLKGSQMQWAWGHGVRDRSRVCSLYMNQCDVFHASGSNIFDDICTFTKGSSCTGQIVSQD
ncbi:hypothetical protein K438DRAFT_1749950 [Mycena galopus ATCC 62051]|nr:hypothetical protein K438DRAFT_1749950 [Mycena galopus ATCC 62051]